MAIFCRLDDDSIPFFKSQNKHFSFSLHPDAVSYHFIPAVMAYGMLLHCSVRIDLINKLTVLNLTDD